MTAPKWARADEQVEIVCWRGPASALAARLRLSPAETVRLKGICRTARPGFLVLDVHLHNPAPVLSALRHRLMPAAEVASGGADGQLPAHLMGE